MTMQTLTITVPDALLQQLKQLAARSQRTLEDEAVNVLAAAVPVADKLPADLEEALSPLALLSDEELWRAARNQLAAEAAARLEELHQDKQRKGLTEAESQELAGLLRQYERMMLVRAQAAALLHQRGHDVSGLLAAP